MTVPLRIGFVNDIGQLGGIEMMLLLLVRRLPRDQFTPVYFAPEPGPMVAQMQLAGAEVINVPRPGWWSTSFYLHRRKILNPPAILYDLTVMGRYIWRLAGALCTAKIDVLHSSGMISQIGAGVSTRLTGIPHVAHVQDIIGSRWIRDIYAPLLGRLADRIAAISTAVGMPYSPHKTCYIPNVADLDRWNNTPGIRESLGINPDQTLIGMVGRLTPWKGQRIFLAAAEQLAKEDASYRFLIVGDDSVGGVSGYRTELQQQAAQNALNGRVQFLGRRADVLDVMAACDMLVHASTKPEPFGIVIVEAMAMQKPVIATAMGGPLDIIEDGVDGLLIQPGDPHALGEAIRYLKNNPETMARIAEGAWQKSHTKYSATSMTTQFAALYQELASRQIRSDTNHRVGSP